MRLFYDNNSKLYFTVHKKMLTTMPDHVIRCFDKFGISVGWNDFNIASFIWLSPCELEIGNEEIL